MKTKLFISAICLFIGISTFAQDVKKDKRGMNQPPVFPSEQMIKDLNLSQKQVEQMKSFMEEQKVQNEKIRKEAQANRQKSQETMKAHREAAEKRRDANLARIKSILTPEQYTKFLEMRTKNQPRMKDGKPMKNGKKDKRLRKNQKNGNGCGNCPEMPNCGNN